MQCFSAGDIFEEVREDSHEDHDHEEDHDEDHDSEHSSLDEEDFKKASASILLHLVEGYCIKEAQNDTSKLPPKTFFISTLFGGKKVMTETELEKVVEKLGIGKVSPTVEPHTDEEDDHAGHKHRRSINTEGYPQETTATHNVHRRYMEADHHGHEEHGHEHEEGSHGERHGDHFNSTVSCMEVVTTYKPLHEIQPG